MIKQVRSEAEKDIEKFLGRKVFLELFVKVGPKWREDEICICENMGIDQDAKKSPIGWPRYLGPAECNKI